MSLEAITAVEKAEEEARKQKADALQAVKNAAAAAESAGKKAIEETRRKAAAELQTLNEKADGQAEVEKADILRENEARKVELRAQAESRMEQAASCIAERIVNG